MHNTPAFMFCLWHVSLWTRHIRLNLTADSYLWTLDGRLKTSFLWLSATNCLNLCYYVIQSSSQRSGKHHLRQRDRGFSGAAVVNHPRGRPPRFSAGLHHPLHQV